MVIGIDNGNANTKTLHTVFNSGLIESSTAIPMARIVYNSTELITISLVSVLSSRKIKRRMFNALYSHSLE